MANNKATNMLAAGGYATKAAPQTPAAPLPRVAVAAHLAAAAAAVEDFIARVHMYFDRVEGGFESPLHFAEGASSTRCCAAWDTPDCLGRAMEAITELLFVVNAYDVESGPIRRGMDGAWLNQHTKWSCDEPWSALCIEVIDAGRGIAEKKAEVQRGFERESLTFKWASDATMAWAEGVARWLRGREAAVRAELSEPLHTRCFTKDNQPFLFTKDHIGILSFLARRPHVEPVSEIAMAIKRSEDYAGDMLRELATARPPLVLKAEGKRGFGISEAGALSLRDRGLLPSP